MRDTGGIYDFGTPELHERHIVVELHDRMTERKAQVVSQFPIDLYYQRSLIDRGHYDAACKLFGLFERSGQYPSSSPNYDRNGGGSGGNYTQQQLEARQEWRKGMGSVSGRVGQLLVLNVVCYGHPIANIKHCHGYKRSDQLMCRLREALDDLARFYRL